MVHHAETSGTHQIDDEPLPVLAHVEPGRDASFRPRGSRVRIATLHSADRMARDELLTFARDAEVAGIESLWLPEVLGRDPFTLAGYLLANTTTLQITTGIANVYARDPAAMVAGASTLAEFSDGRFQLGLGVSNAMINKARGNPEWQPPRTKIESYVEAMRALNLTTPRIAYPLFLAAHGPTMLATARRFADGANTYLMTLEHTRRARDILGPSPALNTVMFCLVEPDPNLAREIARKAVAPYIKLEYYHRVWHTLGFANRDFESGGSDALIDATVAHGDLATIKRRVKAQFSAGATRVVVIPLASRGKPDLDLLTALANTP